MSAVEVVFLALAVLTVASALLVVSTDHLVHAALWLVVTLGGVAGCYLTLSAEFVAWVQVLIYVGAVVVLVLFALMLTRAPTLPAAGATTRNRPVAALAGVAASLTLGAVVWSGFSDVRIDLDTTPVGSASSVGDAIFRHWVLPFEVLSVVLLAALVGAIVLSRHRRRDDGSRA